MNSKLLLVQPVGSEYDETKNSLDHVHFDDNDLSTSGGSCEADEAALSDM